MDFYAVLDQIMALLQQRGRVSYQALKRQFNLDDAYLDDLKIELIDAQQVARDDNGRVLVWVGEATEGFGQVILLSGEAGIGKSRLVYMLKEHVAPMPHTRLECHTSPYYRNTALYPLTDLLHRTLAFTQDDTAAQQLAKLEQALG